MSRLITNGCYWEPFCMEWRASLAKMKVEGGWVGAERMMARNSLLLAHFALSTEDGTYRAEMALVASHCINWAAIHRETIAVDHCVSGGWDNMRLGTFSMYCSWEYIIFTSRTVIVLMPRMSQLPLTRKTKILVTFNREKKKEEEGKNTFLGSSPNPNPNPNCNTKS